MTNAKILVVEDERIVALHLKQQLTRLGYQVVAVVASGEHALRQVTESPPDVVLMDIHIEGGIDGVETAKLIPPELQIPVIYLTAFSDDDTLRRARDTTPYGYLLKPFTERELQATIQMVLARHSADRTIRESERRLEELVAARTAELVAANRKLEQETAERLNVERALSEARKMEAVGQLTAGIAHELNNVLMVVTGSLDLFGRAAGDAERVGKYCEIVNTSISRGVRLIKQLLMFARRQVMFPEDVSPNTLISDIEMLMSRGIPENIEVLAILPFDIGSCRIDAAEFQAAILNLVRNASDAMPASGKIIVETSNVTLSGEQIVAGTDLVPGSYVMVTVSDTGSGIPPDILPRVFEPFFTTKDVGKGSGLGLSQVYGFAKESGGHVSIYSEVGFGTTVKLYLPISTGQQPGPKARQDITKATGPKTVLLVEDDDCLREVTASNLASLGYEVLVAEHAAAALVTLRTDKPIDILFSDVVLPGGMSGAALAIFASQLRPTIKTLLTSGYPATALTARHEFDSSMPLLQKPYRLEDLASQFSSILQAA
jgi:signal transduction histidine kinase